MCSYNMKDESIQEIQTTFFAIKTAKVETGHIICVESEVYNLQKNLLYEFHIIDQEDECRRLNCCLEMMLAKQLGEPLEGESYCFYLALDEETELYHVQSYIKTSDKPILREYLERAGRNPDNKVLTAFSGMTEEQKASLKRQLDSPEYAQKERKVCIYILVQSASENAVLPLDSVYLRPHTRHIPVCRFQWIWLLPAR